MSENAQELIDKMIAGEIPPPPIAQLLGIKLLKCRDGMSTLSMRVHSAHHNPLGTLHGGVLCDLADAAMGMAFASTLNEGEVFGTINLQINFIRSVVEAELIAEARTIHRGRSVGFLECTIKDTNGNLIATATSTCKVFKQSKK